MNKIVSNSEIHLHHCLCESRALKLEEAVAGGFQILKSFAKLTGKHLRWSLFLNNVAGLRPATLFFKKFRHRFFPEHIFENTFLQSTSRRLLLNRFDGQKF